MTEHIISDDALHAIMRTCYEAGKNGREVFTVRCADGPEIVRCRDCVHFKPEIPSVNSSSRCDGVFVFVHPDPDGFCAWGRKKDAD